MDFETIRAFDSQRDFTEECMPQKMVYAIFTFVFFYIGFIVFYALVLYIDTSPMNLPCSKAIEKTRNEKPCSLALAFRVDYFGRLDW